MIQHGPFVSSNTFWHGFHDDNGRRDRLYQPRLRTRKREKLKRLATSSGRVGNGRMTSTLRDNGDPRTKLNIRNEEHILDVVPNRSTQTNRHTSEGMLSMHPQRQSVLCFIIPCLVSPYHIIQFNSIPSLERYRGLPYVENVERQLWIPPCACSKHPSDLWRLVWKCPATKS